MIIKTSDAQRIALEIEGIKPNRPMTHDLIKNIGEILCYDIQEVYIHTLAEGVFYTKFVLHNGLEEFEVECGAGDGLALAVLYKRQGKLMKSVALYIKLMQALCIKSIIIQAVHEENIGLEQCSTRRLKEFDRMLTQIVEI